MCYNNLVYFPNYTQEGASLKKILRGAVFVSTFVLLMSMCSVAIGSNISVDKKLAKDLEQILQKFDYYTDPKPCCEEHVSMCPCDILGIFFLEFYATPEGDREELVRQKSEFLLKQPCIQKNPKLEELITEAVSILRHNNFKVH